ncbi:MAG: hypothetical protein ACO3UU_07765 [Minisyncoccia bacterium]
MTVTNVGYSTAAFIFTQRQIVILLSGNSPRAFMPVYAKTMNLHKGVDNKLQFQFLNQEQKPVDITGKNIICRILNYDGTEVLIRKGLTLELPLTGIAYLQLNAAELEDIPAQMCHYSLEVPVGEFGYPVFVDPAAGARGQINVVDSVLPSFVPSEQVTIPTGQPFPNLDSNNSIDNVLPNANTYYSSVINTNDNPVLTLQAHLYEYNGDVSIEGTFNSQLTDWYPITGNSYFETTETVGYTIKGFHPFVRMVFTSNTGVVSNILAR